MHYVQKIISLEDIWPCRRTRWWLLMIPKKYDLKDIQAFPQDGNLQHINQLFMDWPHWPESEEIDLLLTEEELRILQDERYGDDIRWLREIRTCPCILHSYATVLRACPCGCRKTGFSFERLLRDGVRGFYIRSPVTHKPRWLHPREAALLCGLNPQMWLPADLRAGLCLVGQCASPYMHHGLEDTCVIYSMASQAQRFKSYTNTECGYSVKFTAWFRHLSLTS